LEFIPFAYWATRALLWSLFPLFFGWVVGNAALAELPLEET
jgi:hypothetical protein